MAQYQGSEIKPEHLETLLGKGRTDLVYIN